MTLIILLLQVLMDLSDEKTTGIYTEPLNITSTMSRIIPRASPAAMPTMRRLIVRSSNMVESVMVISLLPYIMLMVLECCGLRLFISITSRHRPVPVHGSSCISAVPAPEHLREIFPDPVAFRFRDPPELPACQPYDECRRIVPVREWADHRPARRPGQVAEVEGGCPPRYRM